MKKEMMVLVLVVFMYGSVAMAQSPQSQSAPQGVHEPPPQAYTDCQGKKAGDTVQHTTREGKVAATCVDSPKGLVARPNQPRGNLQNKQQPDASPSAGKDMQR